MPWRPRSHLPAGRRAERERRRDFDRQRGSAASRGYDGAWRRLRQVVLAEEPLCRMCLELGRVTPAAVVDHIVPIARRPDLRLDRANLQALCKPCHDGVKQAEERTGRRAGCDADGVPLDPRHPWRTA